MNPTVYSTQDHRTNCDSHYSCWCPNSYTLLVHEANWGAQLFSGCDSWLVKKPVRFLDSSLTFNHHLKNFPCFCIFWLLKPSTSICKMFQLMVVRRIIAMVTSLFLTMKNRAAYVAVFSQTVTSFIKIHAFYEYRMANGLDGIIQPVMSKNTNKSNTKHLPFYEIDIRVTNSVTNTNRSCT